MRGVLLAGLLALVATGAHAQGSADGERLFHAKCGICHEGAGPGVFMLNKRLGPDRKFLAERTDLEPPYIRFVARHGLRSMPPLNRIELPDSELDQIIAYLTRVRR